jgi:hypothetical protein
MSYGIILLRGVVIPVNYQWSTAMAQKPSRFPFLELSHGLNGVKLL